jgi:protein-disulfide isomerase
MNHSLRNYVVVLTVFCALIATQARGAANGTCLIGSEDSPAKMEVFLDYECPSCRIFYTETLRPLLADYAKAGKLCMVFRNYPLEIHPHAVYAARYAEGALRMGIRQELKIADALFTTQDQWSKNGDIEAALARLLNKSEMDALRKQMQDPYIDDDLGDDVNLGLQQKVDSTPTFFLTSKQGTEKIAAALTYAALQRRLNSVLGK